MNEQSIDAITTPCPNKRQSIARLVAAMCETNHPSVRRPERSYAWAMLCWAVATIPAVRDWAQSARPAGLRRVLGLVIDIWGYRLDNPEN